MAISGGLLSRKALLLAKVETVGGQDAMPTPTADAIQVIDPQFSIDPNVLEREIVAPDLSPFEHVVGRKLASISFTAEFKSNGTAQSGDVSANEPKLGTLLRGCGYTLLGMSGGYSGIDSTDDVDDSAETITIAGHRFVTGDGPVQVTLDSGALPTGLAIDTDYWVIRVDDDTISLASSFANAIAGTAIDLTDAVGEFTLENVLQMPEVVADPSNDATAPSVDWYRGTRLEANRPPVGITVQTPVLYTIEVTTGGASGVAQVTITNNNTTEDDLSSPTPETITTETPLQLGGSGATVTPDWPSGNLTQGDKWRVMVYPKGIRAVPLSEGFQCLTIYLYKDGLRYRTLANQGTFTLDATAGNYGTMEFTFTGQYTAVIDAALPTNEVYETTLPQQIELGLLTWGSNVSLVAEQFTFDQGNEVVPRPDVNQTDGFAGVRISNRTPVGGFNPEATLVATEDFWGDFSNGLAKTFTGRAGTVVGNQCIMYGPRVQINDIAFGDRDGIDTFENGLAFRRLSGDDEVEFVFA